MAAKFIVEEDDEAMAKELREAFRLYDKEGDNYKNIDSISFEYYHQSEVTMFECYVELI